MKGTVRYFVFFVAIMLLQIFLFDNLDISVYIYPPVYLAFVLLLPVGVRHGWLLGVGLLTGVVMDFFTGMGGPHTIASLASAFVRPFVLNTTGRTDSVREFAIPAPQQMGGAKWLRYATLIIAIHCSVLFFAEALSFSHLGFTIARIAASGAFTLAMVWFIAVVFPADIGREAIRKHR